MTAAAAGRQQRSEPSLPEWGLCQGASAAQTSLLLLLRWPLLLEAIASLEFPGSCFCRGGSESTAPLRDRDSVPETEPRQFSQVVPSWQAGR